MPANQKEVKNFLLKTLPSYMQWNTPSPTGMIVMGIGGKAEKLLNSENVIDDQLLQVQLLSMRFNQVTLQFT